MKRKLLVISISLSVVMALGLLFQVRINSDHDFMASKKISLVDRKSQIREHIKAKKASLGHDKFKFDNPNEFADYHWGIRTRASEAGPGYVAGDPYNELRKAKESKFYRNRNALRVSDLEFTERGPANVPGRTRAILVLPGDQDKNTWLAGGVGGGIWKTIDGGDSWDLKTQDLPSLAISWFALSESQPEVIYASTGEAMGGGRGIIGNGILKSTDGGETWTVLPSTLNKREFSIVGRIIVDHNDPDVVLICSTQGEWDREFRSSIFKSSDGGVTWQETYSSNAWISQIIADPADFNTMYAAKWASGVLKSTDAGESWEDSSFGINKVNGRLELAIAPTNSNRLYAAAQGDISGAGADLYVSSDAGVNWSIVDQKYNDSSVDFFRGQGDYDNTIAVNPFNEDDVYFGGVNLWRTQVNNEEQNTDLPVISVSVARDSMSFWNFMNFGGEYYNGKLEKGELLALSSFVDVEIITGEGKAQKGHRFTVNKQGSGVPETGYSYEDYVEVPFEVWDIENNRQLMVSFRDQQEDGLFNLIYQNTEAGDEENHSREYIFIHAVEYTETANEDIAQQGGENTGHAYQQMYFYWPVLRDGYEWSQDQLVADTITIDFDIVNLIKRFGELAPVSDAYGDYVEDLNPAYVNSSSEFAFHPDHHNLIMIPMDLKNKTFKILNANDGGVFVSNTATNPGINDGDWESRGIGYNTGQFYSAVKKPGEEVYLGGLQDNGTWKSPDDVSANDATSYSSVWGGDGFDVLWNYLDTDKFIVSTYNNRFYMTENNGRTWRDIGQGITGFKPFFSKLASSNSTPDVIYTVSSTGVYKSTDFGKQWNVTEISENWGFSNFIDIKVSSANPNIVWAGNGMSDDMSIHVSTDGGSSFTPTNNFTDAELGFISGLATHPVKDSVAYALFSFSKGPKILRTENLGETWDDISGFQSGQTSNNGFPDVAIYSLLVRPDETDIIWAGTEIGIFESMDNGTTWSFLESSMGAAAVWDMNVMDDEIVIATHGRGIFTAKLNEPVEVILTPVVRGYGNNLEGNLAIDLNLRSTYDSTIIDINGTKSKITDQPKGLTRIEVFDLPLNDSLGVSINSFKNGKLFAADPFHIKLFEVNDPVRDYAENFNEGSDDFVGALFLITKFNGFDDFAIHTGHPYEEGINYPGDSIDYVFQLRTPIIVASNNAFVKYRDIAVVEPGEAGSVYPRQEFYDYVVVEGSKDGIIWKSLAAGYDARKNAKWLDAFNNVKDADKSMFVEQTFDLLSTFNANDTIFIRFKLHSDPLSAGWGWAIDDLSIQEIITALPIKDELNEMVKVFPNPIENQQANFVLTLQSPSSVKVDVFNVKGQIVATDDLGLKPKGKSSEVIELTGLSSGIYVMRLELGDKFIKQKIIVR